MQCDQIDLLSFLGSELNAAQTSSVAEHLEACPDCQDRLRLLLEMRLNRAELRRLRPRPSWRRAALWPVAAVLVMAVLAAYWLTLAPRNYKAMAVTTPYAIVPPQLRSAAGGGPSFPGAAAYAQNDWTGAERQIRPYLQQHPNDYEATFYLANILYGRGELRESEALLAALAARNPADNRVQWYMANAALRRADLVETRQHLVAVIQNGGEFSPQAATLLQKLPK